MGQNNSVPSRGRRKSFRNFRSPFPRRSTSHQSNLSATFSMSENEQKIEQLNVNTASEEELMTLPGITRNIAQSIVEHRKVIGRFKKVEDLALVSGIGAEKLDNIRPEICVFKRSVSSRAQSMDSLKSNDSKLNQKPVDVNKANVFELQTVHGITQELAANIVHHRDKKGLFKTIDGLLKVRGVDEFKLGSIRSQLTVNPEEIIKINGVKNGTVVHTPRHRKSLSAPLKISLNFTNGYAKAPIYDIFDLLSAYSCRPIIEEDFKYVRNGARAIRIATWNIHNLCLQKAENLGFREVFCRTVLENRLSIIALQEIEAVSALKLLTDELNNPFLRRVVEYHDNSRSWNYRVARVPSLKSKTLAFLYDSEITADINVQWRGLREFPSGQVALGRFSVADLEIQLVNLIVGGDKDKSEVRNEVETCLEDENEVAIVLGDFTQFGNNFEELARGKNLLNILPLSTNTHSLTFSTTDRSLYSDNILLFGGAKRQFTGLSGVVRRGLTHMAIPRGWAWGGPASEHCPVWCEIFLGNALENC